MPRNFLFAILFLAVGMGVSAYGEAPVPADPPNFVILVADDMGWEDATPYGHPSIRTPNLQRLADHGMRFDHAFVTTSSCSPSRASILTGKYPHQTGAEQLHWPLPEDQTTFTDLLREAGYWTASAGKWHLGDAAVARFDLVIQGGGERTTDEASENELMPGGGYASGAGAWVDVLKQRPEGRPFLAWLSSFDPHRPYREGILDTPHAPEDVIVPAYLPDTPEVRKDLALYYDEIARLDHYVGSVLNELDRQQIAENTFVLFMSDNGAPFPRAKTTVYDSGVRTPWIVRFPAGVEAGSTTASLVSAVDLAPTLLDLAGVESPPEFEGESIVPILNDPSAVVRDHIFAEKNWHDFDDRVRAVRDSRYKYIRNFYTDIPNGPPADAIRGGTFQKMRALRDEGSLTPQQHIVFDTPRPEEELYLVADDPQELYDVSQDPAHAEALERLRDALETWREATSDAAPAERTPDEYDRETGDALPNRTFGRIPPAQENALENPENAVD